MRAQPLHRLPIRSGAILAVALLSLAGCATPKPIERTAVFHLSPGGYVHDCSLDYDQKTGLLWQSGCTFDNSYSELH